MTEFLTDRFVLLDILRVLIIWIIYINIIIFKQSIIFIILMKYQKISGNSSSVPEEINYKTDEEQQKSNLLKIIFLVLVIAAVLFLMNSSTELNGQNLHKDNSKVEQVSQQIQEKDKELTDDSLNGEQVLPKIQQVSKPVQNIVSRSQQQRFGSSRLNKEDRNLQKLNEYLQIFQKSRAQWLGVHPPKKYIIQPYQIQIAENLQQLPMCIYSHNVTNRGQLELIQISLSNQYTKQNYTNFIHIFSTPPLPTQPSFTQREFPTKYIILDTTQTNSIISLKQSITANCPQRSIVVIANNPLKKGALSIINLMYQLENIWITYYFERKSDQSGPLSSVSSFYLQIMKNIPDSSLMKENSDGLASVLATLLRLAQYHAESVPLFYLYQQARNCQHLDCLREQITTNTQLFVRKPMMYLQPNKDSQRQINFYLQKITGGKAKQPKFNQRNNITLTQMLRAIEYFSLKKLPDTHFLNKREYNQYQYKYNISQYTSELALCIVVPSYNNIDDSRYQKVFETISMQNYSNYHIIFIDDASTDQTFVETQKYLYKIGLKQKTLMIRNQQQMFATYNINNAIHNFCQSQEIAVLVDGDDELIGKQVFRLINYSYQKRQNWLVYFTQISNIYMYGVSKVLTPEMFDENQPRKLVHIIGALRTFYTDLYRKIDQKDHKDKNGEYLDSLYDDAMQFPMMEMSGFEHMEYISQIVYFYNQNYGNNDGSTPATLKKREEHREDIISRPKYKKINNLFAK